MRYFYDEQLDLQVPRMSQTSQGTNSIRYQGAKIWNGHHIDIKLVDNLEIFK